MKVSIKEFGDMVDAVNLLLLHRKEFKLQSITNETVRIAERDVYIYLDPSKHNGESSCDKYELDLLSKILGV